MNTFFSSKLTYLNSFGIFILSILVCLQWRHDYKQKQILKTVSTNLHSEQQSHFLTQQQLATKQIDIDALKSSLTLLQTQHEQLKITQEQSLNHDLKQQQTSIDTWKKAIEERDSIIKKLEAEILQTRARLKQAIDQLKQ